MTAGADSRLAQLTAAWRRFTALCVTGSSGKTTTTSMIAAIVAAAGEPAAGFTTLRAWVGDATIDAPALDRLPAFLAAATAAGARSIAVEVVSLALATGFARNFPADVAVFTNLLEDHRKTHRSRDAYLAAKAELFARLGQPGTAILNAADPASAELARAAPARATRLAYATREVAPACARLPLALQARSVGASRDGLQIAFEPGAVADALGGSLSLRVAGQHNAENALAAALAAHAAGYASEAIKRGLGGFEGLPGRFETVAQQPWVIVDFAHTPDALRRVLEAVHQIQKGEGGTGMVTCIFGCGGERNHERRAPLGRVAAELADRVIVTSDNPRGEDPAAIARDIECGFTDPARATWERELDRRRAIETAVRGAKPEDVVLIAGKGHERIQQVRGGNVPWSDADIARTAAARRPRRGRVRGRDRDAVSGRPPVKPRTRG